MNLNDIQNRINSFQPQLLNNFNSQRLSSVVDNLWQTAQATATATATAVEQTARNYAPNLIPSFTETMKNWNAFRPSRTLKNLTLLMEIAPEDRLYLQNGAQRDLNGILVKNNCAINLNLPINIRDMPDTSQVTITGPADNVLEAYLEVRLLIPITIWFDLKLNASLSSLILDPNVHPFDDIQKKYGIGICVVPIQAPVVQPTPSNHISIYIRSNRGQEDNLKIGIEEIFSFIENNNCGNIYPNLQTKIDVPTNKPEIVGRTYALLDPIAIKTSTQITVQRSASNLMSCISITGHDLASILAARTEIGDRFVVELNFDVSFFESKVLENFSRQMERMCEEFGVHILMKPSPDPNQRQMILRGTDREVRKVFDARKHIVCLLQNPSMAHNHNNNNILPQI